MRAHVEVRGQLSTLLVPEMECRFLAWWQVPLPVEQPCCLTLVWGLSLNTKLPVLVGCMVRPTDLECPGSTGHHHLPLPSLHYEFQV